MIFGTTWKMMLRKYNKNLGILDERGYVSLPGFAKYVTVKVDAIDMNEVMILIVVTTNFQLVSIFVF